MNVLGPTFLRTSISYDMLQKLFILLCTSQYQSMLLFFFIYIKVNRTCALFVTSKIILILSYFLPFYILDVPLNFYISKFFKIKMDYIHYFSRLYSFLLNIDRVYYSISYDH